jgi:hypothetical protein
LIVIVDIDLSAMDLAVLTFVNRRFSTRRRHCCCSSSVSDAVDGWSSGRSMSPSGSARATDPSPALLRLPPFAAGSGSSRR